MRRFFELSGLCKRRYYKRTGRGGPLLSALQAHFEGALLNKPQFERFGPTAISKGAGAAASWVRSAAVGPVAALLKPAARLLSDFSEQQRRVGEVLDAFVPFTAEYDYTFRCDHPRAACARLGERDRQRIGWAPETIDWRRWFLDVHMPALERWVFPKIEERIRRPVKAPRHHETLDAMLDDMADRYQLATALQRTEADGLSRLSFRDWRDRSLQRETLQYSEMETVPFGPAQCEPSEILAAIAS